MEKRRICLLMGLLLFLQLLTSQKIGASFQERTPQVIYIAPFDQITHSWIDDHSQTSWTLGFVEKHGIQLPYLISEHEDKRYKHAFFLLKNGKPCEDRYCQLKPDQFKLLQRSFVLVEDDDPFLNYQIKNHYWELPLPEGDQNIYSWKIQLQGISLKLSVRHDHDQFAFHRLDLPWGHLSIRQGSDRLKTAVYSHPSITTTPFKLTTHIENTSPFFEFHSINPEHNFMLEARFFDHFTNLHLKAIAPREKTQDLPHFPYNYPLDQQVEGIIFSLINSSPKKLLTKKASPGSDEGISQEMATEIEEKIQLRPLHPPELSLNPRSSLSLSQDSAQYQLDFHLLEKAHLQVNYTISFTPYRPVDYIPLTPTLPGGPRYQRRIHFDSLNFENLHIQKGAQRTTVISILRP